MILKKSKFTAVIGVLLMLSFIIPGQTLLIPQYRMEAQVGLVDSLLGLIVLYTGGATFCYFLIVQYMRRMRSSRPPVSTAPVRSASSGRSCCR